MPKRNDVPVKMDAEVVRKAKIVAAYRGQTLAEFVSQTIGSIVDGLIEQEHARMKLQADRAAAEADGRG